MEQKVIRNRKGELSFRRDIEKIFEHNGFTITSIEKLNVGRKGFDYQIEFNGENPYYEDWYEAFSFDGSLDNLKENLRILYENFDVNNDVRIWAKSAGKNGVPDFRELVRNAEYKDKTLKSLSEEINLL